MSALLPPSRSIEVLSRGNKVVVVVGMVLLLGAAGVAVHGVLFQAGLSTTERVIGSVIAVGFGGMGLLFLIDLPGVLARHTLVFDHDGLAYRVTISWVKSFRVSWGELTTVTVSTATRDDRTNHATFVRLDLVPSDPASFALRHPEMVKLRAAAGGAPDVWRLPLGPDGSIIAPISQALHDYGGGRDGGVTDDGRATGWTYR